MVMIAQNVEIMLAAPGQRSLAGARGSGRVKRAFQPPCPCYAGIHCGQRDSLQTAGTLYMVLHGVSHTHVFAFSEFVEFKNERLLFGN